MRISTAENIWELTELNSFKRRYFPHYRTDKYFKGTVVNRALPSLHERSLKITLTVPLNIISTDQKNVKLGLNVNHKVGKWIKLETRNLKLENRNPMLFNFQNVAPLLKANIKH